MSDRTLDELEAICKKSRAMIKAMNEKLKIYTFAPINLVAKKLDALVLIFCVMDEVKKRFLQRI